MEEKEPINIRLSTAILLIIIVALIGGIVYFVLQNNELKSKQEPSKTEKQSLQSEKRELQTQVGDLTTNIDNITTATNNNKTENEKNIQNQNNNDNYIANFSKSVSNELGKGNNICINLSNIDSNNSTGYVIINNKHEAYIYLSNYKEFSSADNLKKIADNVVNAWYCEEGQDAGNNYIVFSKEDGAVTYVRFRSSSDGKAKFESDEKVLKGITNISNIIPIEGNGETGIGGLGVLFIKTDGTCLSFSTLDDLCK